MTPGHVDLQEAAAASGPVREPLAVVGLGCRLPGGHGPAEFWSLLAGGHDAVRPVPSDRLVGQFHHPDPGRPGRTHATAGAFLDGVEEFDADFFGIAPQEARYIDPMFRMLLETAWAALEDAGLPPRQLAGSPTGVFVGVCGSDFLNLQIWAGSTDAISPYTGPGTLHGMASGRLSHAFDLQGPAMSVDTACSSSLVAMHLAANSLRRGECERALVGGVSLLLSPDTWINLSQAGMISADGRCKTFDAAADGYGRGEGCGVIVLRRLSDAVAAGDRILAVIRGSAVNHDGRSASISAPNGFAQRAVLREALADACVDPGDVGYLEAHGTGTPLGDPIELAALHDVFGAPVPHGPDLLVGSVKTNIGHLEAAAGIAGLIKVILSFEHGLIPAHLNVRQLNPRIQLGQSRIRIATAATPWPATRPWLAGVSSFGVSGTNAHVLLEAPPRPGSDPADAAARPVVVTVSARTPTALRTLAAGYREALRAGAELVDLARTANAGRDHLAYRAAVVAESAPAAIAELDRVAGPEVGSLPSRPTTTYSDATAVATGPAPTRLAFLYAGQGEQRAGLGSELYRGEPAFSAAFDEAADAFRPHLGVDLRDLVLGKGDPLDRTDRAQPALFAFEYALTRLWDSMGVRPDAVLGHSLGAYAAACAAGTFDLTTAAELVAVRGRLMQDHTEPGVMYAVLAGADVVHAAIADETDRVAVAAVNGPAAVSISGAEAAVDAVVVRLRRQGVPIRRLPVSRAFHSPLMEPILDEFEEVVRNARLAASHTAVVSDHVGDFVDAQQLRQPEYWRRHAREPVRFADGLRTLVDAGCALLVEIGPGTALTGLVRRCLTSNEAHGYASLAGSGTEPERVQRALASIYTHGGCVDWDRYRHGRPGRLCRLPTYPFERSRQLNEAVEQGRRRLELLARGAAGTADVPMDAVPYAGTPHWLPSGVAVFTQRLSAAEPGASADHQLFGQIVVPGACWLAGAAHAAWRLRPDSTDLTMHDVRFTQPLVLAGTAENVVQYQFTPEGPGWRVEVHSSAAGPRPPERWTCHAEARVAPTSQPYPMLPNGDHARGVAVEGTDVYRQLRRGGLGLGPSFRWIRSVRRRAGAALAELRRPEGVNAATAMLPGLVDACLQATVGALSDDLLETLAGSGRLLVPMSIGTVTLARREVQRAWCDVQVVQAYDTRVTVRVHVHDDHGEPILLLDDVQLAAADPAVVDRPGTVQRYVRVWRPWPVQPDPHAVGPTLVWPDSGAVGPALTAELERRHEPYAVLSPSGLRHDDGRVEPVGTPGAATWQALAGRPWRGLLCLRTLDFAATTRDDDPAAVGAILPDVLALTQGWTAGNGGPIWLVTRGAQRVGDAATGPASATVLGLGRTLAAEYPRSLGGLADLALDDGADRPVAEEASALADLLARGPSGETEQALRGGQWQVPRLTQDGLSTSDRPSTVRPDGAYLITGGLGRIGLAVARWLIDNGATYVALNGRSDPTEAEHAAIGALAAQPGVRVEYLRGDVADPSVTGKVVGRFGRDLPPLRGVVHAAGILDDGVLAEQTWPRVEAVLRPKVAGGWNLHRATAGLDLDLFVLCSSVAGLLGSPGQAGYAAANSYLDALAAHRVANGLPGLSVAWGPWAGSGLAGAASVARRMTVLGLRPMTPGAALAALGAALMGDHPAVAVLDADWDQWRRAVAGRVGGGMLAELAPANRTDEDDTADLAMLVALDATERGERILRGLRVRLAATMDTTPARIGLDVPLTTLGLDSLMGIDLKNRVEAAFRVPVPTSLILRGPTLRELAEHVSAQLPLAPPTLPTTRPSDEALLAHIDEMSDAEVNRLLAEYTDPVGPQPED